MNLISLFAGAGGLDIGLEDAGFKTVLANEINNYACDSLKLNKMIQEGNEEILDKISHLPQIIKMANDDRCRELLRVKRGYNKRKYLSEASIVCDDIRNVSAKTISEIIGSSIQIDLIAGGPPCQPFSRSGKQLAIDDERNGKLFSEFARLAKEIKPRAILLENVKGLLLTKVKLFWHHCSACQRKWVASLANQRLDISIHEKCICGNEKTKVLEENTPGGTIYLIEREFSEAGYTCQWKLLNSADFGVPQIRERLFFIGFLDKSIRFEWPTPEYSNNIQQQGELFSGAMKPWKSMREALWNSGHSHYGKLTKKSVLWVKNIVRPHDEPVTWPLERPSPTVGAHQGAKLAIAPNGVPSEQLKRQQWHTLGKRQSDSPPVFVEHKMLSDAELLKLQSFPDFWFISGTRMERAFQIGNAVPPQLAFVVGKQVYLALNGVKK